MNKIMISISNTNDIKTDNNNIKITRENLEKILSSKEPKQEIVGLLVNRCKVSRESDIRKSRNYDFSTRFKPNITKEERICTLYYVPIIVKRYDSLEVEVREPVETTISAHFILDVAIDPRRDTLIVYNLEKDHTYYKDSIKVYEGGILIDDLKLEDEKISFAMYYDEGSVYLVRDSITRINLDNFTKEKILTGDMLEKLNGKYITSLCKDKNQKWYILVINKDSSSSLYVTDRLGDVNNWNKILHWENFSESSSFKILPNGSIITSVPKYYFDVNGKEVKDFEKHKEGICSFDILSVDPNKLIIFYTLGKNVYYTSLLEKYGKWEVIKQKKLLLGPYTHPIKLITVEEYGVISNYLKNNLANIRGLFI